MGVRENKVETYLKDEIEKLGGISRKWVSPGVDGVPDQIIILKGIVTFIEVKTIDGVLSGPQIREHNRLKDNGATVVTLYGTQGVDEFITWLRDVELKSELASNILIRAKILLADMLIKCRSDHKVDQHNPYTWAELNQDLMKRLKEFMYK